MSKHEVKNCPRCRKPFECKAGNITQCKCAGLVLSQELRAYMELRYSDCLCRNCLEQLEAGLALFREKYVLR